MAPPFPAASQPSNTRIVVMSLSRALRCSTLSRPCCFSSSFGSRRDRPFGDMSRRARTVVRATDAPSARLRAAAARWTACSARRCRIASRIERRHRQAAIPFVGAFDDRPRRVAGARALHDALRGRDERLVHPPVLPLALGDAPSRQRVALELFQALLLRALGRDASRTSGSARHRRPALSRTPPRG